MGYLIVVSIAAITLILYIDFNYCYILKNQEKLVKEYKELLESREKMVANLINVATQNHIAEAPQKPEYVPTPSHMNDEELAAMEEIARLQNEPA